MRNEYCTHENYFTKEQRKRYHKALLSYNEKELKKLHNELHKKYGWDIQCFICSIFFYEEYFKDSLKEYKKIKERYNAWKNIKRLFK